ncbi:MAG: NTP transferase domain-containing protein [Pseudorhodoplanes sp.]|nr:NTP transferase domain-containing protein [Pseudorhodoplanes sp.]
MSIVVFARLDSQRLPGKALAMLAGRPLLGHVIARVRRAGLPVIIATSDRELDNPIAIFAQSEGVQCFRGHTTDVAQRALACLDAFCLDALVRISGDSPFIDPNIIRDVVRVFENKNAPDIVTNTFPRTFPPGQSVEVIDKAAMRRVVAHASDEEREHVTQHIYGNPESFRIINCASSIEYRDVNLTVDTEVDLERARSLFSSGVTEKTSLDQIVKLAREYDAQMRGAIDSSAKPIVTAD